MKMYTVYDRYGKPVKSGFSSWKSAYTFIIMCCRYDWTIK